MHGHIGSCTAMEPHNSVCVLRSLRGFLAERSFRMIDGGIQGKVDVPCLVVAVCGQGKSPLLQFYWDILHSPEMKSKLHKHSPPGVEQFTQAGTNNCGIGRWLDENLHRLMLMLEDFFYLVMKTKHDPDAKSKVTLNQLICRINPVANSGGERLGTVDRRHNGQKVSMCAGIQGDTLPQYFGEDPSGVIHRLEFTVGHLEAIFPALIGAHSAAVHVS